MKMDLFNTSPVPTTGLMPAIRFTGATRCSRRLEILPTDSSFGWQDWKVEFLKDGTRLLLPRSFPVATLSSFFDGGKSPLMLQDPQELLVYVLSMAHWRRKIDVVSLIPKAGKFLTPTEFLRGAGDARRKRNQMAWRRALGAVRRWRRLNRIVTSSPRLKPKACARPSLVSLPSKGQFSLPSSSPSGQTPS